MLLQTAYVCSVDSAIEVTTGPPGGFQSLKKLAEIRHVVPGQQAQCKRELIPSAGANNRKSLTLFKRRAGPRNQELTTSRRTKGSAGSSIAVTELWIVFLCTLCIISNMTSYYTFLTLRQRKISTWPHNHMCGFMCRPTICCMCNASMLNSCHTNIIHALIVIRDSW